MHAGRGAPPGWLSALLGQQGLLVHVKYNLAPMPEVSAGEIVRGVARLGVVSQSNTWQGSETNADGHIAVWGLLRISSRSTGFLLSSRNRRPPAPGPDAENLRRPFGTLCVIMCSRVLTELLLCYCPPDQVCA